MKMFRENECVPMVCMPTPEELLKAVKCNKSDNIRSIINKDPRLLSYLYPGYITKRILEAACGKDLCENVTVDTINLLIALGADLEDRNVSYRGMRVIHFAAESMNVEILTAILNAMEEKQVNCNLITDDGDTALMHLLKYCDSNHHHFLDCIKLLASKIDVNCIDNNGAPAIYIAAKKGLGNAVKVLKTYELDVDSYKGLRNETARHLIVQRKWFSSDVFPNYIYSDNNMLIQKIYANKVTESDLDDLEDLNKEYHCGTLLQTLVQCSLVDLVKKLMENPERVNWNKTTDRNAVLPIYIALERGDYETLGVLLRNPRTDIQKDLLCRAMCNFDRIAPLIKGRSYKKCALVCLEDDRTLNLVNHLGEKGNYPLHFACRYADEPTILALLEKKASLANCNEDGYLTMNDMRKRTLEAHLDSCLTLYENQPANKNDEKLIQFDFTTLLPIHKTFSDSNIIDIPAENGNNKSSYHIVRDEVVINPEGIEMNVPIFMSRSVELKQLITHPMLAMFINLKWQQVSPIYYLNLLFYIILCIFLYIYIFLNYINEDYDSYGDGIKVVSRFVHVISVVCLVALILRELFQMCLRFWRYIKNIENYIELILICTMIVLLLPVLNNNYHAKRQVASVAILFSAMEFFLLIGKIPKLSTNIVILRTVSLAFSKLLLWYSILICAFALSFYTLFSGEKQEEGDEPNFFTNPALAAIKTIVMLTGEFDAGNINFDSIPIISHLIFLMFVFMISMVLFNLMNGLAVADTQTITNQSELYSYISQIQYIAYIEGLLQNHQLSNYLKKLCNASYFASNGPHIMSVPLQKGDKSRGYFDGSESKPVPVRQSLVKRAKVIIEERRVQREVNVARDADKAKFEAFEKMLQEMSKKIELILEKKCVEEN